MKLRGLIGLVCTLISVAGSLHAQEKPSLAANPIAQAIAQNAYRLDLTGDGLSGPGGTFLLKEADAAHYLMIGESHGNVETPQLSAMLATALKPKGYGVLAVEVGPISAAKLDQIAESEDGMAAMRKFHAKYPFAIPFFYWEEEAAMFLHAKKLGFKTWGLDQEFIASARLLLDELKSELEGTDHHAVAAAWKEEATAGFQHFASTGDDSKGFISSVDVSKLTEFAKKLPAGKARARQIVEELRATAVVYQHYGAKRYYLNNYDRIRLMKTHLAQYLEAAGGLEKTPKAIFKFGSMHMGRGYSPLMQLDLGNAGAELAAAQGSDSLHLNLLTLKSTDKDGKVRDWTAEAGYLGMFAPHVEGESWSVFDLRPLRQLLSSEAKREAQPELSELAFRFDVLVLAPSFRSAKPMIPLPF